MPDGVWSAIDSVVAVVAVLVGFAIGFFIQRRFTERRLGEAHERATHIIDDAQREAESRKKAAELEVRESTLKARAEFESDTRRREREIHSIEQRILAKEEQLARKLEDIERRLGEFTSKDTALSRREKQVAEKET